MKHPIHITISMLAFCAFILNACYKEKNPNEDNFEIVGRVPQVSELTPSTTTPTAGSTIELTVKLSYVKTTVKELKFYQRIGTSGAYSFLKTEPFTPNFVPAERVHVVKYPYNVPNEPNKSFSLQVEAVTTDGLVSVRRTMTPPNVTIRP
ncbi:MAG: hypothetical protein NZM43_01715 [Saprospiraceae bacterium]|nr:hypothetical protein [Saprospiraceae bacterium]MDW8483018.1 hypothetical protein [Saprospiraceae bacterium]